MVIPHHYLIFLVFFIVNYTSLAATNKPTQLVDTVCKQVSNYTFCVDSLSSDPRTRSADQEQLLFIAFQVACSTALGTRDYIAEQLKNLNAPPPHNVTRDVRLSHLQKCSRDYDKAVSYLEVNNDNSNFDAALQLADLAGEAARVADHCQAAFGRTASPTLTRRNRDLKLLCEICIAIADMFVVWV
ncbi:hypothetical protein Tsubulata_047995 [Turnera subulata]|uniref:Pectinesterase inhibitor domain-containing protein n=1 Tax=Turnera subulata TaxID=218843 RepID=A0A9Q0FE48_9ROSI|nr:hypothetical protein Tsubulata_047995 [Turnera subulata]